MGGLTPAGLLEGLEKRGITVEATGAGTLRLRGDRAAVTPAILSAVEQARAGLLRALAAREKEDRLRALPLPSTGAFAGLGEPSAPAPPVEAPALAPILMMAHPAAAALYAAAYAGRLTALRASCPVSLPSGDRAPDLDLWTRNAFFDLGWAVRIHQERYADRNASDRDTAATAADVAHLCDWFQNL